jgi:hypothetical protein
MECPDCVGKGTVVRKKCTVDKIEYPEAIVNCFRCDGTGELCDRCGESVAVCENEGCENEQD